MLFLLSSLLPPPISSSLSPYFYPSVAIIKSRDNSKISEVNPRKNHPLPLIPTHHHPHSLTHNINYLANGRPYKITVNNKQLVPSITPLPTTITNQANSPVTWITNTWGFNGQPVNIFSHPARGYSRQFSW